MRDRIHGGPLTDIEDALFDAWHTDAITHGRTDVRPSVLMVVATNQQAATLGERARNALLTAGLVDQGPSVALQDNHASVGDHIVTRRNDRRLRSDDGSWVVNGDVWTITAITTGGDAQVRRHHDDTTLTLPAGYLAEHCHLGYATTAHRCQGVTVDRSHALVTSDASHDTSTSPPPGAATPTTCGSSPTATATPSPPTTTCPHPNRSSPASSNVTTRPGVRCTRASHHDIGSLARLGAIYEDAVARATATWLDTHLASRGHHTVDHDRQWPALVARVRQLALAGRDLPTALDTALDQRPIEDAASIASVLHWRLGALVEETTPRRLGPIASLPPGNSPHHDIAQQAAQLIASAGTTCVNSSATTPSSTSSPTSSGPAHATTSPCAGG